MDVIEEQGNEVILVGFGRFGQVIGRLLHANNINPIVIDHDPDHIERVRRFGYKAYYGDVVRHDVLQSIGAENARLIILTGEGTAATNQAVEMIQSKYPNLAIVARAHDRTHAMHLINSKVESVTRESFYSAVEMGKKTLVLLGFDREKIDKLAATYVKHDLETLNLQLNSQHDEKALISIAKSAREQLEQILESDQRQEQETKPETIPKSAED